MENSLSLIKLSRINKVSLKSLGFLDGNYSTTGKNSLSLIKLSSINKVFLDGNYWTTGKNSLITELYSL